MLGSIPELKSKVEYVENEYIVQCEGKQICIKNNRYYTRKHIWAKRTFDGNFKIGVTDYAQNFLKEKVALVEIFKNPTVGDEVKAGEIFGVVYGRLYANLDIMRCECMAFDLTAPVGGRIVELNHAVMDNPQSINESPYEKGWIAIIAPNSKSDLSDLVTPMKYREMLERKEKPPFRII